jgi:hypothetical protein
MVGPQESPKQSQQRCLAGAAVPDDSQDLTGNKRKINRSQFELMTLPFHDALGSYEIHDAKMHFTFNANIGFSEARPFRGQIGAASLQSRQKGDFFFAKSRTISASARRVRMSSVLIADSDFPCIRAISAIEQSSS